MKVEVTIAPMHGPIDPPPIAITFKQGRDYNIRVEMTPEDFALAVTGRLVHGTVTRAIGIVSHETSGCTAAGATVDSAVDIDTPSRVLLDDLIRGVRQ